MTDAVTPEMLERARRDAGLTVDELWLRYFELGGLASLFELEGIVAGVLPPDRFELQILVQALNERFMELGRDDRIPHPYFP